MNQLRNVSVGPTLVDWRIEDNVCSVCDFELFFAFTYVCMCAHTDKKQRKRCSETKIKMNFFL